MALLCRPRLVVWRMTNSLSFSILHPNKPFSFWKTQVDIRDCYRTELKDSVGMIENIEAKWREAFNLQKSEGEGHDSYNNL